MLEEEDWVLVRTTGYYSSAGAGYSTTTFPAKDWEMYRKTFPDNKWEELARGTKKDMHTMHRLARGD